MYISFLVHSNVGNEYVPYGVIEPLYVHGGWLNSLEVECSNNSPDCSGSSPSRTSGWGLQRKAGLAMN